MGDLNSFVCSTHHHALLCTTHTFTYKEEYLSLIRVEPHQQRPDYVRWPNLPTVSRAGVICLDEMIAHYMEQSSRVSLSPHQTDNTSGDRHLVQIMIFLQYGHSTQCFHQQMSSIGQCILPGFGESLPCI